MSDKGYVITIPQAASMYGIKPTTLRNMCKSNIIESFNSGRRIYIITSSLESFLKIAPDSSSKSCENQTED